MKTKTVSDAIDDILHPKPRLNKNTLYYLRQLPPDIKAPTVSNTREPRDGTEVHAWMTFSCPSYIYTDRDECDPPGILRQMEDLGWQLLPATLIKADNYRPSPRPGLQHEIPEEFGRNMGRPYKRTKTWPMAPVWIDARDPEVVCFMVSPRGERVRVSIDARLPARISAHRVEMMGGWHYVLHTARLHHPDAWHEIRRDDQPVARIHAMSKAFVDAPQALSGNLYWQPLVEQVDFPMSASEFVSYLTSNQKGTQHDDH